ncbi:MAG: SPW repeat protein [Anaerolineales bacterium]|nr:SPW repeat protein [Anaerolineales bacterium]
MYWLTGILGAILIVAPFILGYSENLAALWSSMILGLVVAAVSLYKALSKDTARWEYGVAAVVGLLAVFAPFMFGFSAVAMAMWATIILGAVIALLAGYLGFFARPQT